jgi:hypothetical protein
VRNFRIYYADGSDADNDAPSGRGVLAIVQDAEGVGEIDKGSGEIVCGSDYYVLLSDGSWRGADFPGTMCYLLDSWSRPRTCVLFGEMATKAEYDEVIRKALWTKDNWFPRERKFV